MKNKIVEWFKIRNPKEHTSISINALMLSCGYKNFSEDFRLDLIEAEIDNILDFYYYFDDGRSEFRVEKNEYLQFINHGILLNG